MNLTTDLIGKTGLANIWRGIQTPCKIVAAFPHGDRLRVVVMATAAVPGYSRIGGLYTVCADDITLDIHQ